MKPKLKTILLVDDNEATNFIHKKTIDQLQCSENIVVRGNGVEALKYLTTDTDGKYPRPDLIFLDINMPAMDGWEFLEEYDKLDKEQQARTVIVMLTTSLNPDDRKKADAIPHISGFLSKPLTVGILQDVLEKYF